MTDLALKLIETTSRLRQILPVQLRRGGVRNSLPQLEVLARLSERPRTVSELAELQGVTKATMSATVSRLAKLGLARRNHALEDHRQVIVEPTPKGRAVSEEVQKRLEAMLDEIVARLSGEEKAALMAGLESLASALDGHRESDR